MRKSLRKMFALILFLVTGTWLTASDVSDVPTHVESVVSGGYWKSGGQDGRYRIIVVNNGWEHVHSLVFLQWLEENHEKQETTTRFSVPIREINEAHTWSVARPEFSDKNEIKMHATNTYSQEAKVFIVRPDVEGKYKVEEQKIR